MYLTYAGSSVVFSAKLPTLHLIEVTGKSCKTFVLQEKAWLTATFLSAEKKNQPQPCSRAYRMT